MAITRIQQLTDFDTNNGVTETNTTFKEESPSFVMTTGAYAVKDIASLANQAMVGWVRFSDVAGGKFRVVLGTTGAGVGKAIDFIFTAAGWKVQYNDITTFDGAATAVNVEEDFYRSALEFYSTEFYKVLIYMVDTALIVKFDNKLAIQITNFAPAGTFWGISGIDTANDVYVSDIRLYENQVFHGNVNINGVQQGTKGFVRMYDQALYTVVEEQDCDTDGNYMIFLEDDPLGLNKYFMIGYVDDRPDIQPRGVANITL